jgi:hypothetical protein
MSVPLSNNHVTVWYIAGAFLIFFGATAIIGNFALVIQWLLWKRPSSQIPLVGGLICSLGFAVSHVPWLQHLWWLPIWIDPGCGPMIVAVIYEALRRKPKPPPVQAVRSADESGEGTQ